MALANQKRIIIAPSVLSANFAKLSEEIEMLNRSEADWIHCDIMDGNFVPNLSFGIPILQAIQRLAKKPLDVHLMIVQPERYLETFKEAGAQILSVHFEACIHLHRTVTAIRNLGMQPGVAINPSTPVELLRDILPITDVVCLMSVNPGFGGQSFITQTYDRIRRLKKLIQQTESKTLIEIDGGVTLSNAGLLVETGADVLVAGNTVFSAPNPEAMIRELKDYDKKL
ncbi:MAG: ribulose-phosphate 3-epimerase [Bacteroidia bacterium]|nr:ribulose-phosphate 3-epimerase [Bacteroidia bacterium]